MTVKDIIYKQTQEAYQWVEKLIEGVPMEKWSETPEVLDSNVSWQVGHLIVSYYYHTMMVIRGHQMDILEKIPMKEYSEFYSLGSNAKIVREVAPELLKEQLSLVAQKSLQIVSSLDAAEWEAELEPTQFPHPVAKNKLEALDWNVKHTMWHCGQLAILKRVVGERQKFGVENK